MSSGKTTPICILTRWTLALTLSGLTFVGAAAQSPVSEKEAKAIENQLIAPCCWRQPVDVHQSPASVQIRQEIREMLARGMSRDQILQTYVEAYGKKILSAPPATGFDALSYVLPLLALAAGGFAVAVFFRRHRANPPSKPPGRPVQVPTRYADLLKREVGE